MRCAAWEEMAVEAPRAFAWGVAAKAVAAQPSTNERRVIRDVLTVIFRDQFSHFRAAMQRVRIRYPADFRFIFKVIALGIRRLRELIIVSGLSKRLAVVATDAAGGHVIENKFHEFKR